MNKITITVGEIRCTAELNDSPTAQKIWDALPIKGRANVWGDEIYFEISVEMPQEPDARQDMEVGELGYWPVGRAFCIFFGPTPVSTGDKPRAYSPVNVLGRVLGDVRGLKSVGNGENVTISKDLSVN
jgi:hypothetical protein